MFERHLDFEFEVGETELGMFSLMRTSGYEFSVGSTETHQVRIEKTRKAVVGGVQAQECVAYIDGREAGRYSNAA